VPADEFEVLTPDFAECHLVQWNVFVKKMKPRIAWRLRLAATV
jgi:hypothetical protein